MEKKVTRKEQAKLTKQNLYQAAISLIESKGFENVSIEDITTKANTAKGTFYLYFKSKQDLIYHTISMYDEIYENTYEKVKDLPTFEAQLTSYLKQANDEIFRLGERILNAILVHNLCGEEKFAAEENRTIYKVLAKMIEKGFETGELAEEKGVAFYTEAIVIFIQGLDYHWCNTPNTMDYIEATSTQTQIFAKGLIALYGKK